MRQPPLLKTKRRWSVGSGEGRGDEGGGDCPLPPQRARFQVLARDRLRGSACGHDGRIRGGARQGGGRAVPEGQEPKQLSSAGTELGPERVGARLQVVALSLLVGGVSGGGGRLLNEGRGCRRQVGFHTVLEAGLQPSAVSLGNRVAQEVGVVPSRASALRSSETLVLSSGFVGEGLAE